jgi:carbonic anhydrase
MLLSLGAFIFILSCNNQGQQQAGKDAADSTLSDEDNVVIDTSDILENKVLSKEQQQALSPKEVLSLLKEGNEDFINDRLTIRNNSSRVRAAAMSQHPKAVILSCLDSRVPVEDVFHRGIGDVFVARVAGNIINEDMLGSMEFGCKVSGAKLILVLGHEHCGAIKSAIDDVKLGNITPLLAKIRPAVSGITNFDGDKTAKNDKFVHAVCERNVELTVANIRKNSPILAEMEKKGKLILQGAVYDMDSGKVIFL